MARYRILAWQDIPTQVQAGDGSGRVSRHLPDWFMQEVDRVAMRDGLTGALRLVTLDRARGDGRRGGGRRDRRAARAVGPRGLTVRGAG